MLFNFIFLFAYLLVFFYCCCFGPMFVSGFLVLIFAIRLGFGFGLSLIIIKSGTIHSKKFLVFGGFFILKLWNHY